MSRSLLARSLPVAALAVLAAGCGGTDSVPATASSVPATFRIASAGTAAGLQSAALTLASDMLGGPIDPATIDSLIINVVRVDALPDSLLEHCHPAVGDSLHGFRPGEDRGRNHPEDETCRPPSGSMGPMGPGFDDDGPHGEDRMNRDSLEMPDSGWGSRSSNWYSFAVVANGHLDLMHLPTDSLNGLILASDTLPAGNYVAARLVIRDATIWFNTAVTSGNGTTLQPDTGYAVTLPEGHGRMGIMTRTGFTVPDGGGNITLIFDPAATARVVVTGTGDVILRPVLRVHAHH